MKIQNDKLLAENGGIFMVRDAPYVPHLPQILASLGDDGSDQFIDVPEVDGEDFDLEGFDGVHIGYSNLNIRGGSHLIEYVAKTADSIGVTTILRESGSRYFNFILRPKVARIIEYLALPGVAPVARQNKTHVRIVAGGWTMYCERIHSDEDMTLPASIGEPVVNIYGFNSAEVLALLDNVESGGVALSFNRHELTFTAEGLRGGIDCAGPESPVRVMVNVAALVRGIRSIDSARFFIKTYMSGPRLILGSGNFKHFIY